MRGRSTAAVYNDLNTLFHVGAVTGTSDGELLERFLAGGGGSGQAAFEEIVRRHGAMVLGVCRRALVDQQAAEDAFQATFLVLALRAGSIRKHASVGPWLHGVAARVARRSALQSRRRRELPLSGDHPAGSASDDPGMAEVQSVLDEELQRLPEKYRRPVILCYLEGQTQAEAAQVLGWTRGTVSGRLARAKDLLRSRLERRGLAPTATILPAFLAPESASAAVHPSLVTSTVRAASALGLAGAEAGLASRRALTLARGVVRGLFLGRIRLAAVLVLVLGASAVAAGSLWSSRLGSPHRDRGRADLELYQGAPHVVGVGYTPDGETALTAEADGRVRFWDVASGRRIGTHNLLETPEGGETQLDAFALSGDGRLIAGSGSVRTYDFARTLRGIWIWSLDEQKQLRRIDTGATNLQALAFSPEGASLAAGDQTGQIQLWDVATGDELLTLHLGGSAIRGIAFSPDGMTLAVTNDTSGVQLWDLGGGRPLGPVDGGSEPQALAPSFSGDGKLLAFANPEGVVTIWDRAGSRVQVKRQPGPRGSLALAFAPDSQSLAVGSDLDGTITVIDARTGQLRWRAEPGVTALDGGLAYAPGGRTILVGGGGVPRFLDAGKGGVRPTR
jgi:RNA polymerase sigma factor (sigma-70 family)